MPIYTKKSNGTWSTNAKKIFAKIGSSTWASAKAVFVKTANGWIQAWPGNAPSVRPSDPISLRLTSYSGPLADTVNFEYINTVMYGDDGSYDGDAPIQIDNTSRKMVYYPDTSTNSTRTTIETSDVFNLSNNSLSDVDGVDGKYVRYSLRAFNNSGELDAFSEPVRVIRRTPEFASTILLDIDASLSEFFTQYALEFNIKNNWYDCVDWTRSYVRWWKHTDTTNYRNGTILQTDYLNSSTIGGRFNRYGSYTRGDGTNLNGESFISVMANDLPAGYYVVGEVVLLNSYTDYYNTEVKQSKASDAIPIVSNVRFLDINGETAIDSQGNIVSDALWDLKFDVSGVSASTTYRVQYRLYNDSATSNWYTDFDGSSANWEDSSIWRTSYNSDGSGDGYLSGVSLVGSTAYVEDRAFINTALLTGSPTYGGGLRRWHLEYRISVQNPGQARVYYNGTPQNGSYFHFGSSGGTFEIMPSTVPTLSATPLTGTSPLSVSFTVTTNSYPSGNASYPRAIGIDYGDGSAIDWQYYSSSNPTRTVNKTYTSGGVFTATVRTIPEGDTSRGTRSRTITSISRPPAPNTLTASTNRTDGVLLQWDLPSSQSANYYEIYWQSSQGTGPVNQSTFADFGRSGDTANAITSKSFLDTTISSNSTRYYRVRARNSSDTTDPNFCSDWFPSPGNNAITGTRIAANLTAPTITNVPTITAGGAVTAFFTGGSGPAYQIYWTTGVAPTTPVTPDASGTSSPLTDNSGPTTPSSGSVRWFMYVRSVATVGETSVGPSSVASAWSSGYEFTVNAANASPPSSVSASVSGNVFSVSWPQATNATKYRIYWTTASSYTGDPASSYDAEVSEPTRSTQFTLSYNTTYYFYVSASGSNNVWTAYNLARSSATTSGSPPVQNATAPTSVTATPGNGSVTVTWSGDTNATKYRIWWSTSSSGNSGVNPAVSYDAERTVRNVTFSLSNGTTYYFWVSASNTNDVWTSYGSSPRGQATPSAPSTPAPVLVSISGNNSLALGGTFSWSFSNSPTSYSVFCQGPTGTVFTTSNQYTYTGTTFRPGYDGTGWQGAGNYTIYVSARNSGGDSAVASQTTFMN